MELSEASRLRRDAAWVVGSIPDGLSDFPIDLILSAAL